MHPNNLIFESESLVVDYISFKIQKIADTEQVEKSTGSEAFRTV